jgi:PAS domain S-box-containing protein
MGPVQDKLRVLILEDTLSDVELVVHELRRAGFDPEYRHVSNSQQFVSHLDPTFDVILADYSLPQFDALQALRILKATGLSVPFIVLTGSLSEEAAVECMKEGATDYLLKDRLARLGSAVAQALEARKLHEEKANAEEQIRRHNAELRLINRIIALSAEECSETAFLEAACKESGSALSAALTLVALVDRQRACLDCVAEYRAASMPSTLGMSFDLGPGSLVDLVEQTSGPRVINDFAHDSSALHRALSLQKDFLASVALMPLREGTESIGALILASQDVLHFTKERLDLLTRVARQLSAALVRNRLGRERRLLSTAIEQTPDAVVMTDASGSVQYINAAFEGMLGCSRANTIGHHIRTLWRSEKDQQSRSAMLEAMTEGREWRGRLVCYSGDGAPRTLDVTLTPIRAPGGRIVNFVGIERDITHEIQLEQRYLQAQKLEAVGRLAGGVAHDFNNLLTAIIGFSSLLEESIGADGLQAEWLGCVQSAAQHATELTRRLLTFSRRQDRQLRVLELNKTVADVTRMLRHVIGDDIELRVKSAPDLGRVHADPGQIEQVLMNLAVNARDAMPRGGVLSIETLNLEIDDNYARTHPGASAGAFVALVVSDTGEGMGEDVIAHAFEPFFTTKEDGKGTGLGLATVYGIVQQSRGHISIASHPGVGTTVTVFLPRIEGLAVPPAQPADGPLPRGSEVVLLVEDNAGVRRLAQEVLVGLGYHVLQAADADSALQLAGDFPGEIALLLTDMVMPRMGGPELADRIAIARPSTRVLFMSGYFDSGRLQGDIPPPTSAFLQKPFTPRALAEKVRSVLDQPWPRACAY